MKNVVIAGTILVDKLKTIDWYPNQGELIQIRSIELGVGGCVPNVSIDMKRIAPDMPIVAFGKVGDDGDAKFLIDRLTQEGVDVKLPISDAGTSYTDVFTVKGGERTFFTFPGANDDFTEDDFDFDMLDAEYLHLGYLLLMKGMDDRTAQGKGAIEVLKRAKARGIQTSIDLISENSDRYRTMVLPCLPYCDNVIINELEAGKLAGIEVRIDGKIDVNAVCKAAQGLKDAGVHKRVIIHAPEFGVCVSDNGTTVVGSLCLPRGYIKGATGAGDAFCAASIYAIIKGFDDKRILEFASAAAACSLSVTDSVSGMATYDEIMERVSGLQRKEFSL